MIFSLDMVFVVIYVFIDQDVLWIFSHALLLFYGSFWLDTGSLLRQQNAGCWKVTLFLAQDGV